MPLALSEYDPRTLAIAFERWGAAPSNARRLLAGFYRTGGLVDLPALRLGKIIEAKFADELPLRQSTVLRRTRSADGTIKLLVGFTGGGAVESVLMPSHHRDRGFGCISSQIGCAMGCDFCASTRNGLERNLTSGEIVEQFLRLRQEAAADDRRLTTIVFMGMGEPMHNLDNVIPAAQRIAGPGLGELGGKHVTISTVGIVSGIDRLAESDLGVHLALSLHAPDDATRSRIVPINRRYSIAEVMAAAKRFYERTGRIVTMEYCLLEGINDSDTHAHALADLLSDFRAHVNLIPYNSIGAGISGFEYRRPPLQRMERFLDILRTRHVVAHFRRTRGDDVNAACGQLRERLVQVGR